MAIIPKPPFPNVPKLPGVPQLNRSLQFPAAPPRIVNVAIAIGRLWQALFTQPAWGIFKTQKPEPKNEEGIETVTVVAERKPVVVPDSFVNFGIRNEYTVSDYMVQAGGFASYNKVANPYETFVRMAKGGSQQARKKFLDQLEAIIPTLDLYDILTPERTYVGVNVLRYEIVREGNKGAFYFSEVDLYFREIREVAAVYSTTSANVPNAREASARPVTNLGTVQPQLVDVTPDIMGIEPPELPT